MNSVERVRAICKERKIPISRLERDLGFANGYIGQLRKGVFPEDRIFQIAEYLSVSVEYLMKGETDEKTPRPSTEAISEERRALNEMVDKMSEAELLLLIERAKKIIESR